LVAGVAMPMRSETAAAAPERVAASLVLNRSGGDADVGVASPLANVARERVVLTMYKRSVHRQHKGAGVAVTQIDLDDEALAEVMRIAGVHTKKEAVNLAMRDYVERFRRIEALARSRDQAAGWDYEGWRAARADEKAVGT